ncbi:cuticle protein 7-like isoform X3 [Procambarus clarkii]|uniref:cuticle protein 7-like isoform X1 n=1 Tax=Procambarus clarkii TaxID=6728 RepID=UPI001E677C70|nr:cuticle protein 7-like [Procambarus clarkii]XP_045603142.1 cuticle protein 7-like isoform X3 [Procambarus clarkii]
MSFKVCLVLVVAAVAMADPGDYGGPVYASEPLPYYYDYNVHDGYKGTNFGQHEKSDGKNVYGSYTVDLPDGRKQRVDYTADHYRGYVAKVSYYGKAQHPKHYGPAVTFFNKGYGHGGGYH